MNRLLFISLVTLIAVSCNDRTDNRKFVGNKQVPLINSKDSKIAVAGAGKVVNGKNFCAYITQSNKNFKITAAYIGFDDEHPYDFSKSLVDTSLKLIDKCRFRLMVRNDTGIFCFTPTVAGSFSRKLAVLSLDNNSNYYLDTLDLKYTSME